MICFGESENLIPPRAAIEEAVPEVLKEPEDWDAEIAADPHP